MAAERDVSRKQVGEREPTGIKPPKPLESALSLLRDSSEAVRSAALRKVFDSRESLQLIPREVVKLLLRERDSALVAVGIDLVGALLPRDDRAAPLLVHFLSDPRSQVASRVVQILATSFESNPDVLIPLYVFCLDSRATLATREIPGRILAYAKERGVMTEPAAIRSVLSNYLSSRGWRESGSVQDQFAWAIAWGLCDPTLSLRQFSMTVLAKAAKDLTPFQTRIVEGACAYIAHVVMHKKEYKPTLFLESLRDMNSGAVFSDILSVVDRGHDAVLEMQREFTRVYLSRSEPPKEALKGLLEFLWETDASLVMAAASNLGVLIHELPTGVGERVLDEIWGVLRLRQVEDPQIYRALLYAFEGQIGHQDWIVSSCSRELMSHPDRITQEVVARILSHNPPLSEQNLERVRGMLRYLAGSEHALVAELAASALGVS